MHTFRSWSPLMKNTFTVIKKVWADGKPSI
jgi:hypothetical protein